jgi:hypothetical protein
VHIGPYDATVPADNLLAYLGLPVPAGTWGPNVGEGYMFIFTPLPPGKHRLTSHALTNDGFPITFNYLLVIDR